MKELNTFRQFLQENEIHEGTWGLGSPESIGSIIQGLDAIRKMADDAQNKKNAAGRGFIDGLKNQLKAEQWNTRLYNIVGDDEFHDAYDGAKAAAELNDFDEVKNRLGDAIMRAIELRGTILKNRGLEENDSVLDEIIGEEKEEVNEAPAIFDEIDDMLHRAAIHMKGDDFADELVQELEVISGGTKILHQALKNIMANNNIPEANPEEDQKIINKKNKR